jgi:ATP-dependent helicase HrpA
VTLHIPLPLLNQVEVKGFEWLIPGLRHELLVASSSRCQADAQELRAGPNYADALLASINPSRGRCWTRWSVSCAA